MLYTYPCWEWEFTSYMRQMLYRDIIKKELTLLSLKNAKILSDKEVQELKNVSEIQNATKLDQNATKLDQNETKLDQNETEKTEIKDVNEHEGTEYGGPPELRTKFDVHTPERQNSTENYQNSTETVRNNTYFDSIELKTISTHSQTVTLFIVLSLFIFIMRFRFHKSKNVLFTIITRLNNNASSIIRKILSSLSAK